MDTKGGTDPTPNLENVIWQLWRYYENDNTIVQHLEVENGIAAGLIEPRTEKPYIHKPWVDNTTHGPKIWYQFDFGGMSPGSGKGAFYQNEVARIEAKFTVPAEKAAEVTLKDNHGGVYAWNAGLSNDNFKEINGRFQVSLSKWAGGRPQIIGQFNETESTLISTPDKWQEYILDN